MVAAGTRDNVNDRRDGIIAIYGADDGQTIRELDQREIHHAALARRSHDRRGEFARRPA